MVLKVGRCVQIRMGLGSEFQREGAAMEKARSPGSVLGPRRWRKDVPFGWAEVAGGDVVVEQVCEVGGGAGYWMLCVWGGWFWTVCGEWWAASAGYRGRGWCGLWSGCGWAGERLSSGCIEVYWGVWKVNHIGCCCNSQVWMWYMHG